MYKRRLIVTVTSISVIAAGSIGIAVAERGGVGASNGCLSGLPRYGAVGGSNVIDSVFVAHFGRGRVKLLVTMADGSLYERDSHTTRWRKLSAHAPGRLVAFTRNSGVLYAASSALYRSRNGGHSWERVTCGLIINAVALSPVDSQTIYLATSQRASSLEGGGLYRTSNGGKSWTRYTRFPAMQPGDPTVATVATSSTDSRVVYVGLEPGGIEISRDGGDHWRFNRIHKEGEGLWGPQLTSLTVGPTSSARLWIGTRFKGVFESRIAAENWRSRGLVGGWINTVVADPSQPKTVFAVVESRGLLQSQDEGATWTRVKGLSREVSALTVDRADGSLYAWGGRDISRSRDHGKSWLPIRGLPW
jgi:photosystem II stability/assembly factor-like uncharacterized protein